MPKFLDNVKLPREAKILLPYQIYTATGTCDLAKTFYCFNLQMTVSGGNIAYVSFHLFLTPNQIIYAFSISADKKARLASLIQNNFNAASKYTIPASGYIENIGTMDKIVTSITLISNSQELVVNSGSEEYIVSNIKDITTPILMSI